VLEKTRGQRDACSFLLDAAAFITNTNVSALAGVSFKMELKADKRQELPDELACEKRSPEPERTVRRELQPPEDAALEECALSPAEIKARC